MNTKFWTGLIAGALAITALPAAAMADGEWRAPDVTVFSGPDVFAGGQSEHPGPAMNTTIGDFWEPGACTYDSATGQPSPDCDRLRFGLAMYRGADQPNNSGFCPDPMASLVAPMEDGGGQLTQGGPYHVAQLQTDAGVAYCSDVDQRTLGESMLAYRDYRLQDELGTNWPDRPQLMMHHIKSLPQTDSSQQDQVRESLLAARELYSGDGKRHISMPQWVLVAHGANAQAQLFAQMIAAAGGTGQCCYKPDHGNNCDPTDPATQIDWPSHMSATTGGNLLHTESQLRSDIQAKKYVCSDTGKLAGPGGMLTDNLKSIKCHLKGSPCNGAKTPDKPANLWPIFSCIQVRPRNVAPEDLAVEYCGSINGTPIDASMGDKDGDGCITLTPGDGLEFVDENQNLFYPTQGDGSLCTGINSGDGWTNVQCPNQGTLCDLNDGSQCTLGRWACVNGAEVCERYPGNDTCDSAACAKETVHEPANVYPNAQFVVDRSGSMGGSRWTAAKNVAMSLADWSYNGNGCDADGTNCDKVRLGIHFWDSSQSYALPVQEDLTSADAENAFDSNGPNGGTQFHEAALLLANESTLEDPDDPSIGIFITDGAPDHAFTAREAVRQLCDLKTRANSPVATYAVGYDGGRPEINSLLAAAGGTGQCCFATDGTCDSELEVSPCDFYEYEKTNGADIVNDFESWLSTHRGSYMTYWNAITSDHDSSNYTDAYNSGTVADELDMVDDVARFLYKNSTGKNPSDIDCATDPGSATATAANEGQFYRHILCRTRNTLSYVMRHRYDRGNRVAEEYNLGDWSELTDIEDDSPFLAHDYVCTGSKFADNQTALEAELQRILDELECTFPLSLLADQDSAPELTDATHVKLYMPKYDSVVEVPHVDDAAGQTDFEDEMCTLGAPNCTSFGSEGWSFANEGRTAVKLSPALCDFGKTDNVDKLTTQVCRTCDPSKVGEPCDYVQCVPEPGSIVDDVGYSAEGEQCIKVEHPCPEDPSRTCESWGKVGRCGMGEYACDAQGFPYCKQVHSAIPEICNGVDDDCDGPVDDLSENTDEWDDAKWSTEDKPYDGWYCGYRDSCRCPGGNPDSIGGSIADGSIEQEFAAALQHQEDNGQCQCGEGLEPQDLPAYQETRTYSEAEPAPGEPQAGCSAGGANGPSGLGATVAAFLIGLLGWRRRRDV